jgi:uncharacterized protein YdaU (DUF1376 family)
MSFAFMPLYTGDYLRDTRHLSVMEHGAYVLALMHCWDQKGPMPLDERRQFHIINARSNDEQAAWVRVRDDFFIRMEDGWYNKRMAEIVGDAEAISARNRMAGQRSAEVRRMRSAVRKAGVQRAFNERSTSVERASEPPPPPPQPIQHQYGIQNTTPPPAAQGATHRVAVVMPTDVPAEVWNDWTAHRRAKKAQITARVLDAIRKEAQAAGWTLEQALAESTMRGWVGFKAQWVQGDGPAAPAVQRMAKGDAITQRNIEVARRVMAASSKETDE